MKKIKICFGVGAILLTTLSCSNEDLSTSDSELDRSVLDIAQTSGQLASGTSFTITGSSADSNTQYRQNGPHGRGHGHPGTLDGLNLLAPTDELLAIVDAESASDFRGLRISRNGGASITHYNVAGETVTLPVPAEGGPQGCSFSGHQFPAVDSLLSSVVETVIDFGSGVTYSRDTLTITRAGKIIINRTVDGDTRTEVTTFENYFVNGIKIEGTKTRTSTYDANTGMGRSATSVSDGKFTFADGTSASWMSERSRTSEIQMDDATGQPAGGSITTEVSVSVTGSNGAIYSHQTTSPLIENIACDGRRHGPVSGNLKTVYHNDIVEVNYGDGSCGNRTITIIFNGVTFRKTIGG